MDIDLNIDLLKPDLIRLAEQKRQLQKAIDLIEAIEAAYNKPVSETHDVVKLVPNNIALPKTHLEKIIDIVKQYPSEKTAYEIVEILYKTDKTKEVDFSVYRNRLNQTFSDAYKKGFLIKGDDKKISIGKEK